MRLILVLRCSFIFHHTLCLLILVALLSKCRFAGSFKHFLASMCEKPTGNVILTSGRSAKALASLFSLKNVAHEQWAILWGIRAYLMCIQYLLKPACAFVHAYVQSCKSIYCLDTVIYRICTYMLPFLTCGRNSTVGFSSKFWGIHVVCVRIECDYENVWMVKLIWVFTGYTVNSLHAG